MSLRHSAAALGCLAACCCVPPAPEPTPAPPTARPAASPSPRPSPTPANTGSRAPTTWMDFAQTEGDWRYSGGGQRTTAAFGPPRSEARFTLTCDRSRGSITLARSGPANGTVPMRILTETRERMVTASPTAGELPTVSVTLAASDPILDAMAFSKGRFAVETAGMPTLYLPSWPEVTRVIEDCR